MTASGIINFEKSLVFSPIRLAKNLLNWPILSAFETKLSESTNLDTSDPQNRIWYKMWQLPVSSVLRKVYQNWQPPKLEIFSNLVSFVTQVWLPQVYQLKGLELMKIYYAYECNSWVSGLWIWSICLLLMIIFLRSIRVGTERLTAKSYILQKILFQWICCKCFAW